VPAHKQHWGPADRAAAQPVHSDLLAREQRGAALRAARRGARGHAKYGVAGRAVDGELAVQPGPQCAPPPVPSVPAFFCARHGGVPSGTALLPQPRGACQDGGASAAVRALVTVRRCLAGSQVGARGVRPGPCARRPDEHAGGDAVRGPGAALAAEPWQHIRPVVPGVLAWGDGGRQGTPPLGQPWGARTDACQARMCCGGRPSSLATAAASRPVRGARRGRAKTRRAGRVWSLRVRRGRDQRPA